MFPIVSEILENELAVVNDDTALLVGHAAEVDPEELDDSEIGVKQRAGEKVRREAIRASLERMTLHFKLPHPGSLWTRPQVLFFGEQAALISIFIDHLPRLFSHHISCVWRRSVR